MKLKIKNLLGFNLQNKNTESTFLKKEIKFKTTYPDRQLNFNDWAQNIYLLSENYKKVNI